MNAEQIREIAIAGHWRAADPSAEIYVTDFDIKNLQVWAVTPVGEWRTWPVRVSPMNDFTFAEINEALAAGTAHQPGTDLGVKVGEHPAIVKALVNRHRWDGRSQTGHCSDCPDLAGEYDIDEVPEIGLSECGSACNCEIISVEREAA